VNPSITTSTTRWRLHHEWRSASDLAALECCRETLARVGIELADGGVPADAEAVKRHALDRAEAAAAGHSLCDLRAVAAERQWQSCLPAYVRRYMTVGARWRGIPMGIHRANAVWVNGDVAKQPCR
jgi:hypothetical protein